ncbi:hypothetical protein K432DRAFT_448044 [Lepidopterella palustris CBS 459.81]|uniref:F-box domain-containing protein n=1 Tax=Lepidopterella palustris CBS 459.81 TaxID=1314670 RepID=A0A8E2DWR6_9PEZI|nr:hypothetical protein K432DRAFT_448044 [Lepidopterella palustris CBS 459.81]
MPSFMDSLPLEILHNIIYRLRERRPRRAINNALATYATVSRQWCAVVESILFKDIKLQSTEFPRFLELFGSADDKSGRRRRRRQYLRALRFWPSSDGQHSISTADLSNLENISLGPYRLKLVQDLQSLFQELAHWDHELRATNKNNNGLSLSYLELICPTHPVISALVVRGRSVELTHIPYFDIIPAPAKSSNLFSNISLPSVTKLCIMSELSRIGWSSASHLALCLPALTEIWFTLDDQEAMDLECRRAARRDFAASLAALPLSVTSAELTFLSNGAPMNQNFSPPSLLSNGSHSIDVFSRSLRIFSQRMTSLTITASQLSPELFWPQTEISNTSNVETPPYWPHLKILQIRTEIITASGKWILGPAEPKFPHPEWDNPVESRPSSPNAAESDRLQRTVGAKPNITFRCKPDPVFFDALALAIALAASSMPKLEALNFKMYAYGFEGTRSGEEFDGYDGYSFSYRCGAKRCGSKSKGAWNMENRVNRVLVMNPRTEWVFQVGENQVAWTQPEEAARLWREKCGPELEEDVCMKEDGKGGDRIWVRKRNGAEIKRG